MFWILFQNGVIKRLDYGIQERKLKWNYRVTSGYRSAKLNAAIGGSSKSQHSKGEAADFEITGLDNYELAEWIQSFIPEFDQLILEFYTSGDQNSGWIHCSYSREKNRKQVLTANKENGKTVYHNGLVT